MLVTPEMSAVDAARWLSVVALNALSDATLPRADGIGGSSPGTDATHPRTPAPRGDVADDDCPIGAAARGDVDTADAADDDDDDAPACRFAECAPLAPAAAAACALAANHDRAAADGRVAGTAAFAAGGNSACAAPAAVLVFDARDGGRSLGVTAAGSDVAAAAGAALVAAAGACRGATVVEVSALRGDGGAASR
jgi:hypothetical protein